MLRMREYIITTRHEPRQCFGFGILQMEEPQSLSWYRLSFFLGSVWKGHTIRIIILKMFLILIIIIIIIIIYNNKNKKR